MSTNYNERNVLIITNYDLHKRNGAAYSRMNCYGKALQGEMCFYSLEVQQFRKNTCIEEFRQENNSLIYTINKTFSFNFLQRNLGNKLDLIKTMRLLAFIKSHFPKKNTSILLYTSNFLLFTMTLIFCKFIWKYKVIIEKNELESGIVKNSQAPKGIGSLGYFILYPFNLLPAYLMDKLTIFADALIVISSSLEIKYSSHGNIERIPVLVDSDLFKSRPSNKKEKLEIVYMGSITEKKDAILPTLWAIGSIKNKMEGVFHFDFYGSGNRHTLRKIDSLVNILGIEKMVTFKGSIDFNLVPDTLSKYDLALLLRPNNQQTRYGFSSKLGEYLAAGLPVLSNNISDNLLYLKNGFNAFITNDISIDGIANELWRILHENEKLTEYSRNARTTSFRYFDYRHYKEKLIQLF